MERSIFLWQIWQQKKTKKRRIKKRKEESNTRLNSEKKYMNKYYTHTYI